MQRNSLRETITFLTDVAWFSKRVSATLIYRNCGYGFFALFFVDANNLLSMSSCKKLKLQLKYTPRYYYRRIKSASIKQRKYREL